MAIDPAAIQRFIGVLGDRKLLKKPHYLIGNPISYGANKDPLLTELGMALANVSGTITFNPRHFSKDLKKVEANISALFAVKREVAIEYGVYYYANGETAIDEAVETFMKQAEFLGPLCTFSHIFVEYEGLKSIKDYEHIMYAVMQVDGQPVAFYGCGMQKMATDTGWGVAGWARFEGLRDKLNCVGANLQELISPDNCRLVLDNTAELYGEKPIVPWLMLGGLEKDDMGKITLQHQCDYEFHHSWNLGWKINNTYFSDSPKRFGRCDLVKNVLVWPCYSDNPRGPWARHFLAYLMGAEGIKDRNYKMQEIGKL